MSEGAAPPPRVRLHLTVTDVGPTGPLRRGAEVMILSEVEDQPKLIGADSVDAAVDLLAIALKPLIKRLLWGADQPPERRRDTVPDPVAPLVAAVDVLSEPPELHLDLASAGTSPS